MSNFFHKIRQRIEGFFMNQSTEEPQVRVSSTPNPDAYMFRVNETLIPTGTREYIRGDDPSSSPLAERILPLDGVELILIAPRFITVRKDPEHAWTPLSDIITQQLKTFLQSGEMAIIESMAAIDPQKRSEIELRIIALLDEEVRPAIAQDGGDVVFHGFDNGTVKLQLIGACGTCPSSTATLHYGIENLLREEIPEVECIEQV